MSRLTFDLLRTLARHLGRPISALHPSQDLKRDLALSPREIIEVALEAEAEEHLDPRLDGLERVKTVGELSSFLDRCGSNPRSLLHGLPAAVAPLAQR